MVSKRCKFWHELFKYTMLILYTRVIQEWQHTYIEYPQWLTRILEDDVYYTASVILVCVNAFAVGLAIGFIMSL